jgi:hypothetical protein
LALGVLESKEVVKGNDITSDKEDNGLTPIVDSNPPQSDLMEKEHVLFTSVNTPNFENTEHILLDLLNGDSESPTDDEIEIE